MNTLHLTKDMSYTESLCGEIKLPENDLEATNHLTQYWGASDCVECLRREIQARTEEIIATTEKTWSLEATVADLRFTVDNLKASNARLLNLLSPRE